MGNIAVKNKKLDEATTPLLDDQENHEVNIPSSAPRTDAEKLAAIEEEERRINELFLEDIRSRQQPIKDELASHDTPHLQQEAGVFKRIQPPVEKKSSWFSCFSCFFGKKEASGEEQTLGNSKQSRVN